MLGKVIEIDENQQDIYIHLETKGKFKLNELVNVSVKRYQRTLPQNALYWCFISWVIHPFGGDLQSAGHFSVDALHQDVKSWIEMTHPHDFPFDKKFSTAGLDKKDFGRFFDLIKQDLMIEILGIDISGFEEEYEKYSRWVNYNNPDFRKFMDEKAPEKMPF